MPTQPRTKGQTVVRKITKKTGLFNPHAVPRTREGKNFPGGRHLRRALKNLNARRNSFKEAPEYTKPGSMQA